MDLFPYLENQIPFLKEVLSSLEKCASYAEKLEVLDTLPTVKIFLNRPTPLIPFLKRLTPESEYVIKSVLALGQGAIIFNLTKINDKVFERLLQILEQLLDIEEFYRFLGGIIGYHLKVIELLVGQQKEGSAVSPNARYIHPEGLHLENDDPEVHSSVRWGIENLPNVGMIYPVGGAGDRLDLRDEHSGVPLPAALLPFLGFSLLEGLIRDLQAREYLYFKLSGQQILTPIAIMTSVEKDNHLHILNICKNRLWFGRPADSFYFFMQPVVPVITIEGNWSLSAPLILTLKPGGHGVLWKLADENGVLSWFESQGKSCCLIRQINNPLGGTDHSLFALLGVGCRENKDFGFFSCERLLNSEEGTNVLIEVKTAEGYEYCLTNIEYTDFKKKGIGELPLSAGSPYSVYPANTNILFANIAAIRQCLKICPIPGQLVNMKHSVPYIDPEGKEHAILGGRLESTMQNIADYFVDRLPHQLDKKEYRKALRTFIVYNERSKTISTTKKSYRPGESPHGTPEKTYYDLLSNHHTLFGKLQFSLPVWRSFEDYLRLGPSCIILFHPALGPLYSIIRQKIRRGKLTAGAELQLEIAEIDIEDLDLEGSLLIEAVSPLGKKLADNTMKYGEESRCTLKQVVIRNQGIDSAFTQHYWRNELIRKESLKIILEEGAEFHAEKVLIKGSHLIKVPAHHRLELSSDGSGELIKKLIPIDQPSWQWSYQFDERNQIQLSKKSHI